MGGRARILAGLWRTFVVAALLIPLDGAAATDGPQAESRVPGPRITVPTQGRCVEDTAVMRREHMEFIKHQRDLTVHQGIRTTKYSLAGCVDCHADPTTRRVTGSPDAFCESCHRFAAVKLDCFECHSDRARTSTAAADAGKPQ